MAARSLRMNELFWKSYKFIWQRLKSIDFEFQNSLILRVSVVLIITTYFSFDIYGFSPVFLSEDHGAISPQIIFSPRNWVRCPVPPRTNSFSIILLLYTLAIHYTSHTLYRYRQEKDIRSHLPVERVTVAICQFVQWEFIHPPLDIAMTAWSLGLHLLTITIQVFFVLLA